MSHTKKHLGPSILRKMLSERFRVVMDTRQEAKRYHAMHDVCMSAFAMMFFQDPSLLQFQRRMEDEAHLSNLKTLFHVESIPKDTQMAEVLDGVDPEEITPLFDNFFRPLQRGKHLEQYRVLDGRYVVAIDGSQYFTSEKISCPGCLIKEGRKGAVRYSRQIVQAALMNPAMRQVIPLAPEGGKKHGRQREAGLRDQRGQTAPSTNAQIPSGAFRLSSLPIPSTVNSRLSRR